MNKREEREFQIDLARKVVKCGGNICNRIISDAIGKRRIEPEDILKLMDTYGFRLSNLMLVLIGLRIEFDEKAFLDLKELEDKKWAGVRPC